jgi:uncharacterized protein YkwD
LAPQSAADLAVELGSPEMHRQKLTHRPISTFTLIGFLFLLGACDGTGGPTSPGSVSTAEIEAAIFQLTNIARTNQGVSTVTLNEAVAQVARQHSQNMRDNGFFGHVNQDGQGLKQRLNAAGIGYKSASENLVTVTNAPDPADIAFDLLVGSAEHEENILNPRFKQIGVGAARSGDTYWITQIFIQP